MSTHLFETFMTRNSIKKATYILMAAVFGCFLIIMVIATIRQSEAISEENPEEIAKTTPGHLDSLRNADTELEELRQMDRDIENFMNRNGIRGLSVAVTRNDSLVYAHGFGFADKEANVAMEPFNIMRVASVSKLVTATAIMKLVDEKRVSLDDKVFGPNGILNDQDFTDAIADERVYDITVRHLLTHESGFTNRRGDPMFNTRDIMEQNHLSTPPDARQLTKIMLGRKLGYAPGSGHRYSNFGYLLASLVIEKLTGESYYAYTYDHILAPAGCSMFRPATNYYAERHPEEVKYYSPDENDTVREYNGSGKIVNRVYGGSNVNGLLGGGGWVTSAPGLARFIASIDSHPKIKDIISRESFEEMTRFDPDKKVSFGWSGVDQNGKLVRTGTLSSTNAVAVKFPDGECWIMITNTGAGNGFHFGNAIIRFIETLRSRYSATLPHRDLF